MVFTVNPNAGAFAALQSKSKASQSLEESQQKAQRDLEGQGVNHDARDDVLENNLDDDVTGLGGVKASIDKALATVDVAARASDEILESLVQMKELALSATDPAIDQEAREELNLAFAALKKGISTAIENAAFDGVNAIAVGGQPIRAVASDTGDRAIQIPAQNLSFGGPNVQVAPDQGILSEGAARDAVAALVASIENTSVVRDIFAEGGERLGRQQAFIDKLSDTIESGVGNLIQKDMAGETASLQALQVKQQLGLQSLSIANQSPQAILSLLSD